MKKRDENLYSNGNGASCNMKSNQKDSTSKIILFLSIIASCVSLFYLIENFLHHDGLTKFFWKVSYIRIISAVLIPTYIAYNGLRKQSLDITGAFLGVIIAFILTITRWAFLWSLMTFFVTSSKATKYKQALKKKIEGDEFKPGGQRNWVQVICNGGVATFMAVQYLHSVGLETELPIDFGRHYMASWLSIAVLGGLGCCAGDTWASELGTVINFEFDKSDDPRLITKPWLHVPKGTNGGVSLLGLVASFAGGIAVGFAFYLGILMNVGFNIPNQSYIILVGGLAGFLGSFIDSVMGATLQYSGLNLKTGAIVETPTKGDDTIQHISGSYILDNHEVNLLSSLFTALVIPVITTGLFI